MTSRTNLDYANDILDSIKDALAFASGMSQAEFEEDKKTLYAVVRSLEVMGEASKRIPESVQKKYPKIPWKKMIATRDKLIHGYSGIEKAVIWEVIKADLPPLLPPVEKMVRELEKEEAQ